MNFAFGFILRNTETGALQYHHPSANNNLVLEQPFLVSNREDLERLYQQIAEIDYLEWVRQQRPNSKWVVDLVTNITWFITKIRDHPIGRGKYLPGYIVDNSGITRLIVTSKQVNPTKIICVFSAVWPSTTAITPRIWSGTRSTIINSTETLVSQRKSSMG